MNQTILKKQYEEILKQNQSLENTLTFLRKEARKVLVLTNAWQQEFHNNEINAVTAMYQATIMVAAQRRNALTIAIDFIESIKCDRNETWTLPAITTLKEIDQALSVKTIQQPTKQIIASNNAIS